MISPSWTRLIQGIQACALFALPVALPVGLFAQAPEGSPRIEVGSVLMSPRPLSEMTTVTLIFPDGARNDPAGAAGATFLLGRLLETEGESALLPLGGRLAIQVDLDQVAVTLSVPNRHWEAAWGEVERLLTTQPIPDEGLDRVKTRRLDELLFQQGAPVFTFLAHWQRYALASGLPADVDPGRPTGGTLDDVRALSAEILERRRAQVFQLNRSRVLLMAPPPPESSVLQDFGVSGQSDFLPSHEPPGRWRGEREVMDRELTSTWIGIAWLIPDEAHWVTVSFLARQVHERLNPALPEQGVFRTDVTPVRAGSQRFLTVVSTVDPAVATRRESQILAIVDDLATGTLSGLGLDLAQRRWKSDLARRRANPMEEGGWLAQHLPPDATAMLPDPEALSAFLAGPVLRDLAAGLPEARVLLYGPVPMMEP